LNLLIRAGREGAPDPEPTGRTPQMRYFKI
jgi:hypothetical protein